MMTLMLSVPLWWLLVHEMALWVLGLQLPMLPKLLQIYQLLLCWLQLEPAVLQKAAVVVWVMIALSPPVAAVAPESQLPHAAHSIDAPKMREHRQALLQLPTWLWH